MSLPPDDQFSRIADSVDLPLLSTKLVVVVGVGTVGSQIARELAHCGVGRLRLVDGDRLETHNLPRHVLTSRYVGDNKAAGMAHFLADNIATLRAEALAHYVNDSLSDVALDTLLADADLIVATTDERPVQRRLGRRALSLDIPAAFPALYAAGGGETFIQFDARRPCFFCWDGFRPENQQLRAVTALNADCLAVIQLAVQLILGMLDPRSGFSRLLVGATRNAPPGQLFVQWPHAALLTVPMHRRPNCPSCAVGLPPNPPPRQTASAAPTPTPRSPNPASPAPQRLNPLPPRPAPPATPTRLRTEPRVPSPNGAASSWQVRSAPGQYTPSKRRSQTRTGDQGGWIGALIAMFVLVVIPSIAVLAIVNPDLLAAIGAYTVLAIICLIALFGLIVTYF